MELICPRCGFTNKQAVRCECCLAELATIAAPPTAEPAPPAADAVAVKRPLAPPAAPAVNAPPAALQGPPAAQAAPSVFTPPVSAGLPAALGGQRPSLGQPPPITPEVAKGSGALLAGLIVIGLVGGVFLLKPQPGQTRLGTNWLKVRTVRPGTRPPAAQPPPETAPVASPPAAPAPAPATPPGLTLRAIPLQAPSDARATAAAQQAQREEQAAEAQFKTALNLLERRQMAAGRRALQQLVQKYPATRSAREARGLLEQIPQEREPAELAAARPPAAAPWERVASPAPVRRPAATGGTATAPGAAATPAEPEPETGRRVFTSDDLAGGRMPTLPRRTPSIPASLQSAQVGAPSQSVKAAALDELRLLKAGYESGQWTVEVEYNLVSSHTRPVYLGAWMTDQSVSRRLGYTAAPMASGRATARINLPGVPPTASNLRIVFFEDKGALFFTRDFTISK